MYIVKLRPSSNRQQRYLWAKQHCKSFQGVTKKIRAREPNPGLILHYQFKNGQDAALFTLMWGCDFG